MEHHIEKRRIRRKKFSHRLALDLVAEKAREVKNILIQGVGLDISQGGIGLVAEYPLKEGKLVRLFVPVQGKKTMVPVFSIIKWSKPMESQFRAGLQFLT